MPTRYSLTVVNNSTNFENFNVYQQPPDFRNTNNAFALAAFADAGEPGEAVTFDWSAPSEPNTNELTKCWVAAGNFEPGEISDSDQTTNAVEVVFPPGSCAMQITLNADKSWTVTEG